MKNWGGKFVQSKYDFPVVVGLGDKQPFFGLSRWGGSRRWPGRGLAFAPVNEDDYKLRGNSRSLLYKGGKESHRFTILGDVGFEYDVILKK
jgi:hypothetical protein